MRILKERHARRLEYGDKLFRLSTEDRRSATDEHVETDSKAIMVLQNRLKGAEMGLGTQFACASIKED